MDELAEMTRHRDALQKALWMSDERIAAANEKLVELAAALDLLMNPNAEAMNGYYRDPQWRQHDDVCGTHTMARAYLRISDIVKLLDAKLDASAILAARDKSQRRKGAAWALTLENECWCDCCRKALLAEIQNGVMEREEEDEEAGE